MSIMRKKKLLENLFSKETFINGIKATYVDLLWLLKNLEMQADFLKSVRLVKTKMYIYTL